MSGAIGYSITYAGASVIRAEDEPIPYRLTGNGVRSVRRDRISEARAMINRNDTYGHPYPAASFRCTWPADTWHPYRFAWWSKRPLLACPCKRKKRRK